MAIIECKECKHNISDKASLCPNCGAPITKTKQIKKDNYEEVIIKKERIHPLNTLIYISFFIILLIICIYDITLIKTFRNSYSLIVAQREPAFTSIASLYSSIIINITFISCIMAILSKKTYKLSKITFLINLIVHIIFFINIYSLNFRISIQFYILYIINIIYLLLPRINKLQEIPKIIKKDKMLEIESNNDKLEEYYNKKTYNKNYIITLIISIIISIISILIIYNYNKKPIYHETIIQTYSDYQIEITNDFINVRTKPTANSEKIGEVHEGDIYNVLDIIGGEHYIWYKISFNEQIGYISSSRKSPYLKELYKDKLIVNIFCDDSVECTNYYNKVKLYKESNDIFLINYLDISIKDNKKIYNKLTKFYDDKKELPYITIGTERIYNYSDTVYYIKYPVDKEYNLVDIVKKDNELPILKQPISDSGSYYEE